MSSDSIKPYTLISFDERKKGGTKYDNTPELHKAFEKAKHEGYHQGYKEGFQRGSKEGYDEGLNRASEEIKKKERILNEKIDALEKIIKEVSEFKYEQIKGFLPDIIQLCLNIAKKVVATEITTNKNTIINIIKEALKEIPLSESLTIKINPADSEKISDELKVLAAENPHIHIVTSPEINQGDCYVETQTQIIDASLEEKFKEIENAVNSVLYSKD